MEEVGDGEDEEADLLDGRLDPPAPRRSGLVRSMDAAGRTATITWLKHGADGLLESPSEDSVTEQASRRPRQPLYRRRPVQRRYRPRHLRLSELACSATNNALLVHSICSPRRPASSSCISSVCVISTRIAASPSRTQHLFAATPGVIERYIIGMRHQVASSAVAPSDDK